MEENRKGKDKILQQSKKLDIPTTKTAKKRWRAADESNCNPPFAARRQIKKRRWKVKREIEEVVLVSSLSGVEFQPLLVWELSSVSAISHVWVSSLWDIMTVQMCSLYSVFSSSKVSLMKFIFKMRNEMQL